MKLRRMCGGGTWKREHLTDVRHCEGRTRAFIWDYAGVALVLRDPHNDWPARGLRAVRRLWWSRATSAAIEVRYAARGLRCTLRRRHRALEDSGVVYCGDCGQDAS